LKIIVHEILRFALSLFLNFNFKYKNVNQIFYKIVIDILALQSYNNHHRHFFDICRLYLRILYILNNTGSLAEGIISADPGTPLFKNNRERLPMAKLLEKSKSLCFIKNISILIPRKKKSSNLARETTTTF